MSGNSKKYKVCLIVDNPLRDLDGLTLLAYTLDKNDVEVYLVPMYTQISDVYAIKPDLVLVNYIRPNNFQLLERYQKSGIKVGVLDTEGTAGKNSDEFAKLVKKVDNLDVVDLYCLWGEDQYNSFIKFNLLSDNKLKITGCPRYDFCHQSLRSALPTINDIENYILINTNFPTANPRFTTSLKDEVDTMIKVGFDSDFATQFVNDSKATYQKIIKLIIKIAYKFPKNNFVLRPHPFENIEAYNQLLDFNNVFILQKGTSLEWINSAKALVHLNCSTAIEAAMLDKYAISLEWLNTRSLLVPNAKNISFNINSESQLFKALTKIINGVFLDLDSQTKETKNKIIRTFYAGNDGKASERVSDAICDTLKKKTKVNRKYLWTGFSFTKSDIVFLLQRFLGYKIFIFLQRLYKRKKDITIKNGKLFKYKDVQDVLDRIEVTTLDDNSKNIVSTKLKKTDLYNSTIYSGKSIKILHKI